MKTFLVRINATNDWTCETIEELVQDGITTELKLQGDEVAVRTIEIRSVKEEKK